MFGAIKDFIESSKRILTIAKKPDWQEYSLMIKVTLLGMIIIGLIGYLVYVIMWHFFGMGK